MDFNDDVRQVAIDSDLYNALRVLAFQGAETEEQKQCLAQIDRHAIKFNARLRIERDAVRHELAQSTSKIIAMERRAHTMSSNREKHTLYVKTFSGRWIPCRVVGMDGLNPYMLDVELLTTVGDHKEHWRLPSDKIFYADEMLDVVAQEEPANEIRRYQNMVREYSVKSNV
ncbi:hypothetical protein pEaSNUABM5_00057 [Erwinia phage pEa_SNUABM_5]|uniref:Uncharacterized protein n=1 Tax=Erwinia phage pEa_SNUABM_5 TaxID=2797313 RepID=A0A7T8IW34_9CAUD|nr:hypothetical protein MPK73_gp057 [Erwinia phage pEa_SNUABM_5]QQO90199.1 hypothetical protein pEaSNUABM5_00057 [Erwinia phage pEa_SNUABM_5]